LDVVSPGELYTALASDFPTENILVHGNNKSLEELTMYLHQQVGYIVVDNIMELEALITLAAKTKQSINTLFRVNPGIEAHTHEYIVTAKHTSKFGESIYDKTRIDDIMNLYSDSQYITLSGFHCHIGSQVFDIDSFVKTIEVMSSFINKIEDQYNTSITVLNIGGGFGVPYTKEDDAPAIKDVLTTIIRTVEEKVLLGELHIEELIIEPGRSIVANAGVTLYTIGYTKETYGKQQYLFVDGGMSDNIRPALYQAEYDGMIATKMNHLPTTHYTVAGKLCESGDVLIRDIKLPTAEQGDLFAVFSTGAYTYSMASNYNRVLKPAVVFVEDGQIQEVVKREDMSDLIRNDL